MKRIVVILAAAAMASLTAPVQADVKTGVDAWQQGDYAKAIAEWRPLAEAGDPDAQFNLGQAYKLGRGVQSDMAMAINWYRKAAQQGHLRAEDSLGLLMFQQGDRAGAMPYLERAASRGEPRAQYIVGTSLFNGDVIGKDWVRAYALMSRASAAGLSQATTSLEQMGKYIPEDQRRQGTALAASLETGKSPKTEAAPIPVRSAAVSSPAKPSPPSAANKPIPSKPQIASTSKAVPPSSGNWRVQLGAFSEEGRARTLWSQLTKKVGGLSAYQLYLVKTEAVTRLQAGPLSSAAEAARLCGSIKAAGSDCMPKKM
ncbi:SPOR domain-containing protein [Sphingobium sp. CCH11-B1]|jgi:cell division septation protein DedD|uniref:SPOR domain-containing protein n=1 Tax=Sphingobium sp. CCH11-B1 TaxID=1768781 RepID=UPI00082A211D|nr:SPOR domain-containing protein [Sphingobium sp. CCH11-B1]